MHITPCSQHYNQSSCKPVPLPCELLSCDYLLCMLTKQCSNPFLSLSPPPPQQDLLYFRLTSNSLDGLELKILLPIYPKC